MSREDFGTRKRVAVADVRLGMYVVGLDRSWLQTPFLFHRKLIQRAEEIEQLKNHGICEVEIDTARGLDVGDGSDSQTPQQDALGNVRADDDRADAKAPAAPRLLTAAELAFQPMVRELESARTIHAEAVTLAQTIFDGAGGAPIDGATAARVLSNLQDSITRSPEANLLLIQMRRFQKDLFTHAVNVCVLSLVVATIEGFGEDLNALGMGALLHDIGETRLPRSLGHTGNKLTDADKLLFKQHPILGAALLARAKDIPPLVERIILEHHERIDGSGYPTGAVGADLCLYSQLVALADIYDDMLSGRNQAAHQPTEVLRQLYLQANSAIVDRNLVEKLIRSLGVYPIGSVVELNTGERGVVLATNRSATLKPTVRIITSRNGVVHFHGPIIALADRARQVAERRIIAVLDPAKEHIDPMVFLRLGPGALG